MKDIYGNTLKQGDIIKQNINDDILPKGSQWIVVDFGIEPSTGKNICIIKNLDKNYIMCAYDRELKYFAKELGE